jgi:hypothetical protein
MPKITTPITVLTQQNMNQYKMDLLEINDSTHAIQCPYSENDDWTTAMTITLKLLNKNMRIRNRISTLAHAFYAGKLLNNHDEPRQTWKNYLVQHPQRNELYLYKGIMRTFQTFEDSLQQIFYTRKISLWALQGMSVNNFENDFLKFAHDMKNFHSLIDK